MWVYILTAAFLRICTTAISSVYKKNPTPNAEMNLFMKRPTALNLVELLRAWQYIAFS